MLEVVLDVEVEAAGAVVLAALSVELLVAAGVAGVEEVDADRESVR